MPLKLGDFGVDNSNWAGIGDTTDWDLVSIVPPEGGPAYEALRFTDHATVLSFHRVGSGGADGILGQVWPDGQGIEWEVQFPYVGPLYTLSLAAGLTTFSASVGSTPTGTTIHWHWFNNGPSGDVTATLPGVYAYRMRRAGGIVILEALRYGPGRATRTATELGRTSDLGDLYTRTFVGDDGPILFGWSLYAPTIGGFQDWYYLRGYNPARSRLYQRQPDGSNALIGVAERPVPIRMPDGTLRTWPGATAPLYQKQPDGTWSVVIEASN